MGNMCKHANQDNRIPQNPVINAFQWTSKRDNTSMVFRNPLNNLLKVFKSQNEKHTCSSSAFMEITPFCKDQCCHFQGECIYPFPSWVKRLCSAALPGLEAGPGRQSWAGRAQGPTQQHWCIYQVRKRFLINWGKNQRNKCLIYWKEEPLGAREALIGIEWNYHVYSLHSSLHTQ